MTMTYEVVKQATTQIQAAAAANIAWYVPSQAMADWVSRVLAQGGIPEGAINIIVQAPAP
jgi:hypothetical protein